VRIAVISDVHANLTALNAVIVDLCKTSPDLVVHGGDLMSGEHVLPKSSTESGR